MIRNIFLLLRPHQWVKNTFCFLPLFFDRHVMDIEYLIPCAIAFLSFCFAASGIYCFNDIYDIEADRKHPKKCERPIASGAISKLWGYVIMVICWIISICFIIFGNFLNGNQSLIYGIIGFYILMNIAYCIKLKQKAIVDVFIIAVGCFSSSCWWVCNWYMGVALDHSYDISSCSFLGVCQAKR